MQKIIRLFAVVMVFSGLAACDNKAEENTISSDKKTQTHIISVEKQAIVNHLYYNGSIQPLHTVNIISPVAGTVEKMLTNYGDWVQINQPLLMLRSAKSQQDYAAALSLYLKNKDQYLRSKDNFDATSALYKAGIVDRESYLSDKSQVETNRLAYLTAASALHNLTQNMHKENQDFSKLSLENMADFEAALEKQYNEFTINAAITGIVLMPEKNQNNADVNDKLLSEGSEVKENQILLSLGDMTGIATTIAVNETDINQITKGQLAILTSPALPGLVLQGRVMRVARQINDSANQNIASFPVLIEVPAITEAQRELLRIGMSTKVDIEIRQAAQVKIPIKAVFEKNGLDLVNVIDPKSGKVRETVVETGDTDATQVIITKGLSVGERIIVND